MVSSNARVVSTQRVELEKTRLEVAQCETAAAARRLELERAVKADWEAHPLPTRWWFWSVLGVATAGAAVAIAAVAR